MDVRSPRLHAFVCTNDRPSGGRPACHQRGADKVLSALQTAIAEHPELWGKIRVTGCDCLGPCFDGPNLVVYPEGVWYGAVTPEDVQTIVTQHFIGGDVVAALQIESADDE